MNSGIIRTALTKQLPLELEYREPFVFHESGTHFKQPTEIETGLQYQERPLTDEFACLLSAI